MSGYTTAAIAVAGALTSAYGQIQQGKAADAQAKAQQNSLNYEADQRNAQAVQERATAQRQAIEENRTKRLAMSSVISRSSASGAGALDGSVINIMGDLEEEGTYNANTALYEGEERARDLEAGATINRYEGEQARAAGKSAKNSSYLAAGSTILKNGASIGSGIGKGDYGEAPQSMFDRFKG